MISFIDSYFLCDSLIVENIGVENGLLEGVRFYLRELVRNNYIVILEIDDGYFNWGNCSSII